jgi:hypothetical protein
MDLLSTSQPTPPRRTPLIVAVLALFVALVLGSAYLLLRRPTPAPTPTPRPVARVTPRPKASATATPTPETSEPARPRPTPTPRPAPLTIESDVPGARVFVDRKYLGTTPLDVREVTPGSHRLNVSADGFEMHAEDIEIGEEPLRISVRFREVKLDETLAVVHKHGVGSCRGRLLATTAGLAYEASSGSDSFLIPLNDLERFEVDYLKKNLRVAPRGGKTFNFTVEGPSADPLLVFQKKVDGARRRLASGR